MVLARWQATIVDEAGDVQDAATVEVRREATGSPLALLYSDRAGATPIANPLTVGADGFAAFHVVGGAYKITATKDTFSRIWRYVPIGLAQEIDTITNGFRYQFASSTTDADPGVGYLRFNNATLASVTQIYIDLSTSDGLDLTTLIDSFDDNGDVSNRGTIVIEQTANGAFLVGTVTGSITTASGYRKITVTPIATAGTFVDDAVTSVTFWRAGLDGINPGFRFNFDSSTSMADPGNGDFRLNNATLASVTAAAFDDLSSITGNPDVSATVLYWDDSTNTADRGYILIKKISAPQNFAMYRISGASTDNSGWTQLALTHVASAGSFTDADPCTVEFARSGDFPATASETVSGVVEMATNAEIRSAASGALAIMAEDLETASAGVALTDAATVAVDWDTAINFTLTVTANRAIGNPTNGQPGTWRTILVQGNDATDRTITFGANYLGEVPTITDCDSGRWYLLTIFCVTTSHFVVSSKRALG